MDYALSLILRHQIQIPYHIPALSVLLTAGLVEGPLVQGALTDSYSLSVFGVLPVTGHAAVALSGRFMFGFGQRGGG